MDKAQIEKEIYWVESLISHGMHTGQDKGTWMYNLKTELSVLHGMLLQLSQKDEDIDAAVLDALIAERKRAHKQDNDYVKSLSAHIDALEEDNTRLSDSNKKLVEENLNQEKEIVLLQDKLDFKTSEVAFLSKSDKKLAQETLIQEKEIIYLEEQLHIKSIELAYLKSNSNTTPPEERVGTMMEYRVDALEERVEELEQSQ